MGDLQRSGSRLPRRAREQRAYRLLVLSGAFGIGGAVGLLLAVFTSFGAGWPVISLIIAAVCFFLFRRTVS